MIPRNRSNGLMLGLIGTMAAMGGMGLGTMQTKRSGRPTSYWAPPEPEPEPEPKAESFWTAEMQDLVAGEKARLRVSHPGQNGKWYKREARKIVWAAFH